MINFLPLHLVCSNKESLKHILAMGVTQLKRKSRKNRAISNNKVAAVKRLTLRPDIKKVDIEDLKAEASK